MAKTKAKPKKKIGTKKPVAKKNAGKKKPIKKTITKKAAVKKPVKKTVVKKAVRKILPKKPAAKKRPQGLPEQLLDAALKVLDERQAEDIVSVDLEGKSAMADYVVIASGRAAKQLGAIAHYLREAFAKLGVTSMRVEGVSEGNWVLIDAGDIIVHLFRPEVRRYYNLEQIWERSGRDTELSVRDEE